MPPKRGSSRPTRGARRGRGGRPRGGQDHSRALSDITEESLSQAPDRPASNAAKSGQRNKKRRFQELSLDGDAHDKSTAKPGPETRSQSAKKRKNAHGSGELESVQQAQRHEQDWEKESLVVRIDPLSSLYTASLALLSFVQMYSLDTNADTETITLNLIDLTSTNENWHPGLSGMVQPAACFLIASLLTRRQNLAEDIAASVEAFGVGFEDLVKGYKLLWHWRGNLIPVVGAYGENVDALPEPSFFLGDDGNGQSDDLVASEALQEEEIDERPEPRRWE